MNARQRRISRRKARLEGWLHLVVPIWDRETRWLMIDVEAEYISDETARWSRQTRPPAAARSSIKAVHLGPKARRPRRRDRRYSWVDSEVDGLGWGGVLGIGPWVNSDTLASFLETEGLKDREPFLVRFFGYFCDQTHEGDWDSGFDLEIVR